MATEVVITFNLTGLTGALREIDKLANAFDEVDRSVGKAGRAIEHMGQTVGRAGRSLTIGLTLPIVAIGTLALRSSLQFEDAMTGVAKTVTATEAQLARLGNAFQTMSERIPISAKELARLGEVAGQLGVEFENLEGFVDVVAALGVSTNLSAERAAFSLSRLSNIMGTSAEDFGRLGAVIVALGNSMATTENEIVEMALRLAGAGRIVGLTEAQVLSLSAALSAVGIRAQAGGTSISRVFIDMSKAVDTASANLAQFAKIARLSIDQFAALFREDPSLALLAFSKGLKKLREEGESVFIALEKLGLSNIRTQRALLGLSGASEQLTAALNTGNTAWIENAALTVESARFYARTAGVLAMVGNQAVNLAADFGDILNEELRAAADFVSRLLDGLRKLVEAFAALPSGVQATAVAVAALLAALGPLLVIVGALIASVGSIVLLLPKVVLAVSALSAVLVSSLAAAVTPGGALLVGLGALALVLLLVARRAIKARMEAAALSEVSVPRVSFAGYAIGKIPDLTVTVTRSVTEAFERLAERGSKFFAMLAEQVTAVTERITSTRLQVEILERVMRNLDPTSDIFASLEEKVNGLRTELELTAEILRVIRDMQIEQIQIEFRAPPSPADLPDITLPGLRLPKLQALRTFDEITAAAERFVMTMERAGLSLDDVREIEASGLRDLAIAATLAGKTVEEFIASLEGVAVTSVRANALLIASFGAAVVAVINGTQQIAASVINMVQQILQVLAAESSFLGGLGVPIIGVIGGIFSALAARQKRPTIQPVSIESIDPRVAAVLADTGPDTIIIQTFSSGTGEMLREIEYALRRRTARDAVERLPPGVGLGFA